MAKTAKTTEQNEMLPALTGANGENLFEALDHFEKLNATDLKSTDATYLSLEENQTYNFVFSNVETTQIEGKDAEVVRCYDKTGNAFLIGAAVVVSRCKKIEAEQIKKGLNATLIRIVTGQKTPSATGGGKYLNCTVLTM